jgi:hypothetical protein
MKPTAPFQSLLLRGLLLALGGVAALLRRAPEPAAPPSEPDPAPDLPRESWLRYLRAASEPEPVEPPAPARRPVKRTGITVALTAIFCLGAAFTAAAGDKAAGLLEDEATPAAEATTSGPADASSAPGETTPPADPAGDESEPAPARAEPAPMPDGATTGPPTDAAAPAEDAGVIRQPPAAPAPAAAPTAASPERHQAAANRHQAAAHRTPRPLIRPLRIPKRPTALELESSLPSAATVWLHRVLPDPTPPSRRLTSQFANELTASARTHHVDWAVLLAILRARGELGSAPATRAELDTLASAVARARAEGSPAILAATGGTAAADTAVALAHFNRAVGLAALVKGLEWAKPRLGTRLLRDRRVTIYEGGRADMTAGRIDVRVLALMAYLADTYGSVTVSCLESGHRLYARPGVISAHIYGLAVDIAALGGTSILGNQEPGGITERAVRSILLLPVELRPRQVISLIGLGGPSFPLADHADHIHVGF